MFHVKQNRLVDLEAPSANHRCKSAPDLNLAKIECADFGENAGRNSLWKCWK